ncbi:hypothetical protein QQX98_009178 [Neonectria punicea]|uniref:RING-type domain-containing protein n=1 Tax=Neonectria punicea TaxID=979145 RepID=A0ABR1GT26_9HYPO
MCIKIVRWFMCPEYHGALEDSTPSAPSASRDMPWKDWKDDDLIPTEELNALRVESFDNFVYVRHQEVSWTRCAMINTTHCADAPLQIRTELYSIACPTCTRDDTCLLSAPPFRVDRDELFVTSPNRAIYDQIARCYFEELAGLIRHFIRYEIRGECISIEAFMLHFKTLLCTEKKEHVYVSDMMDMMNRGRECATDCTCTRAPESHNISRALRMQDSEALQIRVAHFWAEWAHDKDVVDPEAIRANEFGEIPNQRWLNHSDEDEQYNRMDARVMEFVHRLINIGPDVQSGINGSVLMEQDKWAEIIRGRQTAALHFVFYAARDPGLTLPFLDAFMRDYILSVLNPFYDPVNAPYSARFLPCQRTGLGSAEDIAAAFTTLRQSPDTKAKLDQVHQRRDRVLDALEKNRTIAFLNANGISSVADSSAPRFAVPPAVAIEQMRACGVCADDFVDQDRLPKHLNVAMMPCCSKPLHFCCFKGISLGTKRCPFCNSSFEEQFWSDFKNPDGTFMWNARPEDVPIGGLMSEPTQYEKAMCARVVNDDVHLARIILNADDLHIERTLRRDAWERGRSARS